MVAPDSSRLTAIVVAEQAGAFQGPICPMPLQILWPLALASPFCCRNYMPLSPCVACIVFQICEMHTNANALIVTGIPINQICLLHESAAQHILLIA